MKRVYLASIFPILISASDEGASSSTAITTQASKVESTEEQTLDTFLKHFAEYDKQKNIPEDKIPKLLEQRKAIIKKRIRRKKLTNEDLVEFNTHQETLNKCSEELKEQQQKLSGDELIEFNNAATLLGSTDLITRFTTDATYKSDDAEDRVTNISGRLLGLAILTHDVSRDDNELLIAQSQRLAILLDKLIFSSESETE